MSKSGNENEYVGSSTVVLSQKKQFKKMFNTAFKIVVAEFNLAIRASKLRKKHF